LEAYFVETPVGIFILDEKSNVLEKLLFSNNPRNAAVELKDVQDGRVTSAILEIAKRAAGSYSPLVFGNEQLAKTVERDAGIAVAVRESPVAEQFRTMLRSEEKNRDGWLRQQSLESPTLKTARAYNEFARRVTLELARAGIAQAAARRDLSAVQAVRAMDDLDKTLNLLAGRVREWYGLHFPEMDRIIEKHDTYARLVAKLGNRKNFTSEAIISEGVPKEKSEELAKAASRSMGGTIEESDLAVLQSFCGLMLELYKFRERAEGYVDECLKAVAPNMAAIVGASLSARLMSIAGSLENLAKMPASTLQVLGAEKALFRSLKTGARPPKHGVIFQHTAIHQSPRWQRGKIARALSGKLSIAARVDAFGGEFIGENLRKSVDKKIDEIKERYKTAPPAKPAKKKENARPRRR
jgi:nucleolar protein 56